MHENIYKQTRPNRTINKLITCSKNHFPSLLKNNILLDFQTKKNKKEKNKQNDDIVTISCILSSLLYVII